MMESTAPPTLSSSGEGIPSPAGPPSSSCQILPPLSIGSGNYERAWNDPPVFSLEVNGMAKPIPTKLTKRVAYPAGANTTAGTTTGSPGPSPPLLPGLQDPLRPPLTILPPTKVDFIPSFPSPGSTPEDEGQTVRASITEHKGSDAGDSVQVETKEDGDESKRRLMKLLEESLAVEPYLEASVAAEVKKCLEILNSKWESLPTEVRVKLGHLGTCLDAKDYHGADAIQLDLSSKFMTHCGPWIMALKQIIRKQLPQ